MVIPAVALAIDRLLFWIQKSLFPHQYGGTGLLHDAWRGLMHVCEDLKHMIVQADAAATGPSRLRLADRACAAFISAAAQTR